MLPDPSLLHAVIFNLRDNPKARWCAEIEQGAQLCRIPLHPDDAWNFDVSAGLHVWLRAEDGRLILDDQGFCRIIKKRGNKKYVRI